jgi:ribose 5-phosphate isomerase B
VVVGGSGNGEAIAANKVPGVRAALAWNDDTASLGRAHNNANVVSIGARMHSLDEAGRLVERFLTTPFSGDVRHARRIAMLEHYESTGELPELPTPPTL